MQTVEQITSKMRAIASEWNLAPISKREITLMSYAWLQGLRDGSDETLATVKRLAEQKIPPPLLGPL